MRKLHLQLRFALSVFFFLVLTVFALGQAQQAVFHGYQRAPKAIPEILDARPTPTALASPKGDRLLVVDRLANPPVSDLAQPMLRLAGIRINPATNGRHHPPRMAGLHIINVADGKQQDIKLPQNPYLNTPEWSPDGQHFVFTNTAPNGIELWVGDAARASAHRV